MGAHNKLPDDAIRSVNRIFTWLLILFGYVIASAMALDTAGWDDPVFNIVRKMPYTPYSWAAILAAGVTIYTVGEFSSEFMRWRSSVVMLGASVCTAWCFALSLSMARMVYEQPERITILWPFFTFFVGMLYASRIIVYANAFTGERWVTNPYQLWGTMFLLTVSLSQMVIGVAPGTIFTEIERPAALQMASVNFLGAAVVMFGLHLKNKEAGINLELIGAASLVATLAWYIASVTRAQTLAGTTLGFGLAEAFLFATLHRSIQIITLKYARLRDKPRLEARMSDALKFEPRHGR